MPIQSDTDVSDGDLRSHHILLDRPPRLECHCGSTGRVVAPRFARRPSCCRDETYAHPATAVIAAGANPLNRRYEVVLFAGLSGEATWRCAAGRRSPQPPGRGLALGRGVEAAAAGRHPGGGRERAEDRGRGALTRGRDGRLLDRASVAGVQFRREPEDRSTMSTHTPSRTIDYPDSDGLPMSDNTMQFRWITTVVGGLDALFRDDPNVFVAGDLLWYPIEGDNKTRTAPDAMVVFGRTKGYRGSYMQWREDGIAPQVVFEVLSPGNRAADLAWKFAFYDRFGVEEYYQINPDPIRLDGWGRDGGCSARFPR